MVWMKSGDTDLDLHCLQKPYNTTAYCKFGTFCANFLLAKSVKIQICHIKNPRLEHDFHISVNNRVILPCESLIFWKLHICEVSQK